MHEFPTFANIQNSFKLFMSTFVELKISPLSFSKQERLLPLVSQWNHAGHYKRHGEKWIFYFEKNAFQEEEITQSLKDENVTYEWAEKTFKLDPNLNRSEEHTSELQSRLDLV